MRKNNTNKLKPAKGDPAKEKHEGGSITSRKASNGKPTRTRESGTPKTRTWNSKWTRDLQENPEMERLFEQAILLQRAGRFQEAITVMEKTVEEYPRFWRLWWYLGGIFLHDLRKPLKAIPVYRQATRISPESERASIGLFHALWDSDRIDEALAEIKRYQLLTNWKCKDYLEIVAELHDKWLPKKPRKKKPKTSPRG
jgi:tetratricopeptide (TPR) repeat protein